MPVGKSRRLDESGGIVGLAFWRGLSRSVGALALALTCLVAVAAQAAKDVPWKNEKFERTSFQEDIKNVLRGLLRQNGLQVIFGDDVSGEVSFA